MISILFVCHGNICRSAIAAYLFQDMLRKAGRQGDCFVESAATSTDSRVLCGRAV